MLGFVVGVFLIGFFFLLVYFLKKKSPVSFPATVHDGVWYLKMSEMFASFP